VSRSISNGSEVGHQEHLSEGYRVDLVSGARGPTRGHADLDRIGIRNDTIIEVTERAQKTFEAYGLRGNRSKTTTSRPKILTMGLRKSKGTNISQASIA
jgi:hypothetical protein